MGLALGINIDHVATIRQARGAPYPDLAAAARAVEAGGADFVTVHLREDRRHIIDSDLPLLAEAVSTSINLEIAATAEMRAIAAAFRPAKVCVVPERREERTTEGGIDVAADPTRFADLAAALRAAGVEVSFFIEPEAAQIEAAREAGADAIELHTGAYAANPDAAALARLRAAASAGAAAGLAVNAGHGLSYDNVAAVAAIEQIAELNIGHAVVARALFSGLQAAVAEMRAIVLAARAGR